MAQMDTLKDEFNGTTAKAIWSPFSAGSATITYDATGVTVTFPATTSGATDGDLSSFFSYNFLDSYAFMHVLAIPVSGAVNSFGLFRLQITSANFVSWQFNAGNIQAVKRVASVSTTVFSTAWDSVNHAWIRIRESGGTTYWETSPDGIDWTVQYSEADPITETSLTAVVGGISTGVDSSPGTFKFDDFNISPASKPGNIGRYARVGNGMSRSEVLS
jgi:hypothetical protein